MLILIDWIIIYFDNFKYKNYGFLCRLILSFFVLWVQELEHLDCIEFFVANIIMHLLILKRISRTSQNEISSMNTWASQTMYNE